MKKNSNISFIASIVVCLIPVLLSAVFYNRLPEQVAIHFNNDGNPDNFAPKIFAAFGLPAIMLVIHLYNWFRTETDPKREGMSKALKHVVRWLPPALSVIMQVYIISYALGTRMNIGFYVSLFMGLLIIAIGNYLPKCRQNYTMGIKLPWTLHNEDNWNNTHRIAGYIWTIGGLTLMLNSLINIYWIFFVVLASIVVIPIIYSYSFHKRNLRI